MGLDQYAYTLPKGAKHNDENTVKREIFYWRKHPSLQGWMENLWNERGNPVPPELFFESPFGGKEFNCIPVRLEEEDIDNLEDAIRNSKLPHTIGFFFGEDENSEEERQEDLNFISMAREALKDSEVELYYSSWW